MREYEQRDGKALDEYVKIGGGGLASDDVPMDRSMLDEAKSKQKAAEKTRNEAKAAAERTTQRKKALRQRRQEEQKQKERLNDQIPPWILFEVRSLEPQER